MLDIGTQSYHDSKMKIIYNICNSTDIQFHVEIIIIDFVIEMALWQTLL